MKVRLFSKEFCFVASAQRVRTDLVSIRNFGMVYVPEITKRFPSSSAALPVDDTRVILKLLSVMFGNLGRVFFSCR